MHLFLHMPNAASSTSPSPSVNINPSQHNTAQIQRPKFYCPNAKLEYMYIEYVQLGTRLLHGKANTGESRQNQIHQINSHYYLHNSSSFHLFLPIVISRSLSAQHYNYFRLSFHAISIRWIFLFTISKYKANVNRELARFGFAQEQPAYLHLFFFSAFQAIIQ